MTLNAVDLTGQPPGGTRQRLADALPLTTPWVVQIFPVYACNFRCGYCLFSTDKSSRGFISDCTLMDVDLYRKCVDDMTHFPDRIKVLRFVGIGEPLLHKRIADMVRETADRSVARIIEILTNGLLLDPHRVDALIAAGLNRLVISVQGTSAEKYAATAGVRVNFDRLLKNLAYTFEHREKMHIYIKIVDTALEDEVDRERFFEIFGSLCDSIAVENTVPIHKAIDFTGILSGETPPVTQFGLPVEDCPVCPQSFFHMQINPDGNVVPCYAWDYPIILGNCTTQSLSDIWNGEPLRAFRHAMLSGRAQVSKVCSECTIIRYRWFPEDDLSCAIETLQKHYESPIP